MQQAMKGDGTPGVSAEPVIRQGSLWSSDASIHGGPLRIRAQVPKGMNRTSRNKEIVERSETALGSSSTKRRLQNVPTFRQLLCLLHCLLDSGNTYEDLGDLAEALKRECASKGFVYGKPPADMRGIYKAIDAVLAQRPTRCEETHSYGRWDEPRPFINRG